MKPLLRPALAGALVGSAVAPSPAAAHGFVGRQDLPIPEWLFGWAAAAVLIVSFVALAALWQRPKLESEDWRPLPGRLGPAIGRALTSRPVEVICGALGVFLLGVVIWSGLAGVQSGESNFAPRFVYVIFWIGLVPLSVLFGDVFRAFNPWRAVGRAFGWTAQRIGRGSLPEPLPYPERLGRWPAAVAIFAFAWMELASANPDSPRNVAIAALVYSAATFVAMALYGVESWIAHGEGFSVYFNLFSRLSPLERRGRELGLRRALSGLPAIAALPGTVALLAVMIGSVSFDGASEGALWTGIAPDLQSFFRSLGLSPERALELAFTVGLAAAVLLVYAFYRLGIAGARSVGGDLSAGGLANAFIHTLVPIALVYVAAHYLTFLLYQGQAIVSLASDPLGHGWDLFGTGAPAIDYTLLSANAVWYLQVGFVIAGHVAALTLAHDRALKLHPEPRLAARSQYWMLGVMVGFTSLALWLLSQANA